MKKEERKKYQLISLGYLAVCILCFLLASFRGASDGYLLSLIAVCSFMGLCTGVLMTK